MIYKKILSIHFMNIDKFLINLINKPERLISTLNELRKVDLHHNIHLFDAIDERTAILNSHNYISNKAYQNILNPKNSVILPNFKSLACAISHLKIWNIISQKKYLKH